MFKHIGGTKQTAIEVLKTLVIAASKVKMRLLNKVFCGNENVNVKCTMICLPLQRPTAMPMIVFKETGFYNVIEVLMEATRLGRQSVYIICQFKCEIKYGC